MFFPLKGRGKIRILFLIDYFCGLGGAEKNLLTLVRRMDRERFELFAGAFQFGELRRELERHAIALLDLEAGSPYGGRIIRNAARYVQFLRRHRIDVVLSYFLSSDLHNCLLSRFGGAQVRISSRRDTGYHLTARHRMLYRMIGARFDHIIAVSDAVKGSIEGLPKKDSNGYVRVIRNGVDTSIFRPGIDSSSLRADWGVGDHGTAIGIVAVYREEKGHEYFFQAAGKVAARFPETRFVVVGGRKDEAEGGPFTEKLKRLAKDNGVGDGTRFLGRVPNDDIPKILNAMDVVVLPSTTEGLSNSSLETLACGVPLVAAAVGGNLEVLRNGDNGFLVPSRNPDAIADRILFLIENPGEARRIGVAARKSAEDRFSEFSMVRNVEKLVEDCLRTRVVIE